MPVPCRTDVKAKVKTNVPYLGGGRRDSREAYLRTCSHWYLLQISSYEEKESGEDQATDISAVVGHCSQAVLGMPSVGLGVGSQSG